MLFRRRKSRWERFTERVNIAGTNRKHVAKRALGVAGGAAGLLAASAATSSLRNEQR
jgi:NADPH-dependent 2,4-dienoyl-CoA reductase/sulfur reductase-like enzyme